MWAQAINMKRTIKFLAITAMMFPVIVADRFDPTATNLSSMSPEELAHKQDTTDALSLMNYYKIVDADSRALAKKTSSYGSGSSSGSSSGTKMRSSNPVSGSSFINYRTSLFLFATIIWLQSYRLDDNMRRDSVCYSSAEVRMAIEEVNNFTAIEDTGNSTATIMNSTSLDLTPLLDDPEATPELVNSTLNKMLEELESYDENESGEFPNEICATTSSASTSRGFFVRITKTIINAWKLIPAVL